MRMYCSLKSKLGVVVRTVAIVALLITSGVLVHEGILNSSDAGAAGGGSGTVQDPFLVGNETQLRQVGTSTDGWTTAAHYRQTADIDLTS